RVSTIRRLGSGRLPSVGPSIERRRGFGGAGAVPADAALPADAAGAAVPVGAAADAVEAPPPVFFSRRCGAVRATTTLLPSPSVARVYSAGPGPDLYPHRGPNAGLRP